ncbi:MAG: FAD-binding protein [Chloroflexi bacterium]|nr:FAD-binding protein [Chloroflexota bacterium]
MSTLEKLGKVTETDVLVIGGGFAGIWGAIRARDLGARVLLVDKAKVARSGCSTFAAGIQFCPTPADDLEVWKKEIVESSDYFADQDWVDVFLKNQTERIQDYDSWGAPLERDEKGKVARIVGRGHKNTRLFQFHGPKLMQVLRDRAVRKGVALLERTMIADLLTSDGRYPTAGRVTGALGFNTRTGDFHIIRAKATVMAAGAACGKRGNVVDNDTGDGLAAAFRAGADLTNMEFLTAGNITVWQRKGEAAGINMLQGHGAYFVNARGERFMEKYDPELKERSLLYRICMGFAKEALEGRGPVYVDLRHLPPETFAKFRRVLPRTTMFWEELGVDVTREKIECTPHWGVGNSSGQGGVKVDLACRTSVPGLYAAGAVTRVPVQGIYALGGIATASCNVMGYIAGESAAGEAQAARLEETDAAQVEKLEAAVLVPQGRKDGKLPEVFFEELDRATVPAAYGMFKNQPRILKVLAVIEDMKSELPAIAAPDWHEVTRANEFGNFLQCAELVFRGALERQESRQSHYREEYPYRDDINWLKLIVMRRADEGLTIRYEPIPLDKWTVRPRARVKIAHPVQMFIKD